jgi:hypothetical protein
MPEDVRLNMLATALSGGRGAVLWVGIEALDGEYMNALRRSLDEIRKLQPYIIGGARATDATVTPVLERTRVVRVNGKTISVSPEGTTSPVKSWAWKSPAGRLVAVINYDREQSHKVQLSAPGLAAARPLFGPAPTPAGEDIALKLDPGEAAVVTW